jgi:hypothetical protein
VLPVGAIRSPAQEILAHARALVLAIDPRTDDPPDPALVRDLLGLTLSEARIASLVGTGLRPGQAAGKLVSLIDSFVEQLSQVFMLRVFPVGTIC